MWMIICMLCSLLEGNGYSMQYYWRKSHINICKQVWVPKLVMFHKQIFVSNETMVVECQVKLYMILLFLFFLYAPGNRYKIHFVALCLKPTIAAECLCAFSGDACTSFPYHFLYSFCCAVLDNHNSGSMFVCFFFMSSSISGFLRVKQLCDVMVVWPI